jgi:hypothetical protein
MASVTLIGGLNAGDKVANGQLFRVVFEPFMPAWSVSSANFTNAMKDLRDDAARGLIPDGEWLTPLNEVNTLPGETVATIDFKAFSPPLGTTVSNLVAALDGARIALSVRSVARIQPDQATSVGRSQATRDEQLQQDGESPTDIAEKWLKRIGIVIVLVLLLVLWAELSPFLRKR